MTAVFDKTRVNSFGASLLAAFAGLSFGRGDALKCPSKIVTLNRTWLALENVNRVGASASSGRCELQIERDVVEVFLAVVLFFFLLGLFRHEKFACGWGSMLGC